MRIGGFFSVAAHIGVVAAGLWVLPATTSSAPTPMVIIPVDLVTVSDETDIAPVTEDAKEDEKPVEEEVTEDVASAAAAKAEEDTVALSAATTPAPKAPDPIKKPDTKADAKKTEKSFLDELDGILASANTPPKQSRSATGAKAANNTTNEAPRVGVGEQRKMTATIADIIRSQMITKRCWTDHSDMADAQRLRATFRVWFGRNGKFARPYELIDPGREPNGDPPMQVFVTHGRRALDICNNKGWQVPEEYFKLPQPAYIDIELIPKAGAK
jgi:hypothetical protein